MSWSTIKTPAIVLSVSPFREADRLYSAFTPEWGKISFVGRGANKGLAKLAAHLEPFAIVDLEIIQGRVTTTVISVDRIFVFSNINLEVSKRLIAMHSLSLVDTHTRDLNSDQALYNEITSWLEFLNSSPALGLLRSTFALSAFLYRMMAHLGYSLSLNACVSCKKEIIPLAFRWHGGKGGLVCSDCLQNDKKEWFAARLISEEAILLLRLAQSSPYADVFRLALSGEIVNDVAQIIHDSMVYHLPFEPRAPFWEGLFAIE